MQITLTLKDTIAEHLHALADASGQAPETLAEVLLSEAVLSAVTDPELLGNNE